MSQKQFCDDCLKETEREKMVKFWFIRNHPLEKFEFCFDCFSKHWKPLRKKFSLKKKSSN